MENNQIDFISDINQFSKIINKHIIINNVNINLELTEYSNIKTCKTITNWELCLGILGKYSLLKTKEVMKIIYCLLSDCCIINNINGNKMDIDLFDVELDRFLRLDVVDEVKRIVKLKIFTVSNTMIVIDCKDLNKYKIYEIHNLETIKAYYKTSKVDFDTLIKDIKLKPKYIGSINELCNNYKIFALTNFKKDNGKIICDLENFLKNAIIIEKQINREYNKFYKEAMIK